jgi:hypothetical protein
MAWTSLSSALIGVLADREVPEMAEAHERWEAA